MASIVVSGDTSGAVTITAPAVAGTTTLTLPTTSGTIVTTGGQTVPFAAGTVSAPSITFTGDTNTGIYSPAADTIAFTEGGVESMRIDSSGRVAIGTATTTDAGLTITTGVTRDSGWTAKLALQSTGSNDFPTLLFSGCSATNRYGAIVQTASTSGNTPSQITAGISFENSSSTAGNITFFTNGNFGTSTPTERMRITSGGNVGIGNVIADSFNAFANQLVVGSGNTNQGITIYTGSANSGSLNFADGTVGADAYQGYIQYNHSVNAMDFIVNYAGSGSPRMRIDSSGNVGINTSSPLAKFEVHGQSRFASSGSSAVLLIDAAATSTNGVDIQCSYYGGAGYGPMKFTTSGLERMRIDANGNVCINATSGVSVLTVDTKQANYTDGIDISNSTQWGYGSSINFRVPPTSGSALATVARIQQFYEASNQYGLSFSTYNTGLVERMRINSEGDLLINTTTKNNDGLISISADSALHQGITIKEISTGNNIYYIYFTNSAGNGAGRIEHTGATTVSYVTSSDARLKTNIVDSSSAKPVIDAIKIREFDWVSGEHQRFGVVAQELIDVAPEAVSVGRTDNDSWGVDYSKLVPHLIKYVQELNAKVEAQAAEIQALKGAR